MEKTYTVLVLGPDGPDFQAKVISDFMGAHTVLLHPYDRTFGAQGDGVWLSDAKVKAAAAFLAALAEIPHQYWWMESSEEQAVELGRAARKKS